MTGLNGQATVNKDVEEQMSQDDVITANELITNVIYSRMNWLAGLIDENRNVDKECGYPETLSAGQYRQLYDRDAISARVVQVLPKESWQVQPQIFEDEDPDNETEFEKDWQAIHKNLLGYKSWYQDDEGSPIFDYLLRADILSGIGHYGVLLLGIDDGRTLDQPLEGFEGMDSSSPLGTEGLYGPNPLRGDAVGYDQYTLEKIKREGTPTYTSPVPMNIHEPIDQPGERSEEDLQKTNPLAALEPAEAGKHRLIFLKPFDETQAQISRYERDPHNPRFMLPQMYLITFNDPRNDSVGGAGLPTASAYVHWSRVIHLADNRGGSDVIGYPRLKQVYNRLWDCYKTYGAAGEGFWQQCFSILSLETNPALGANFQIDQNQLRDALGKIRNKLQRHLAVAGMTAKTLPPNVQDPTAFVNVFIECICIFLGCPVRVFKGSERGELASSQDDSSWNDRLRHRQIFYLTPKVLVPFIDRLIQAKVLAEPKGYSVVWPDLESLSDKDKAAICLQLVQAIQAYIAGQCEDIITPLDLLTEVLKFPLEKARQIIENAKQAQEEEDQMTISTPDEAQQQQAMQGAAHEGGGQDQQEQ